MMAELQSQAEPVSQPVIHSATVVNRYCPASPAGEQRESAVHERIEFALRIPGDEMKGGRHRSQAGGNGVLVCDRHEHPNFTAQGEPVGEPALTSSSHMDEVP